jgi:hypothetical protein
MWSVPRRFSEPSTAARMFAGPVEHTGATTRVRDNPKLRRQYDLVEEA